MRNKSLLVLLLWLPAAGLARERQVELAWSDLEPAIQGKKVALVLPDGVRIEGPVLAVEPDALVMDVRKSSGRALHPQGKTSVPRASAGTLEMRGRGTKWQIIGAAIGAAPGIVACAIVAKYVENEGGTNNLTALCAVPLGAGLGLGYWAGRAADKRVTYIKVKDAAGAKAAP